MTDHRHENWEIYDSASDGDLNRLQSQADGLRQDLQAAENRIYDLECSLGELRAELRQRA
jgi:hypothetical protein